MTQTLAAFLLVARCALCSPPTVTKVEPPDWMSEPEGITLRMLVTGSDLQGATLRGSFSASRAKVSATGTHLFFDLRVPAKAAPGSYPIHLSTASGEIDVPFQVAPALEPRGRFQGFNSNDVIYLIMPDRFANGDASNDDPSVSRGLYDRLKSRYYHGGDLQGIIDHLPYIKSLGVTAIWTTPVYDNANRLNEREKYDNQAITDYHGYGAVDLYAVDEHLGTLAKYRELVDKAHAIGIKVIQDEVANHTGPYHPWVKDAPTPTWFNGTEAHHLDETWRTWTLIDPHATPEITRSTLEGWFANILPDLNQNDPECAQYLIQNTLWWIGRTGLDGIREDTLPYVPRAFWSRWTSAIRAHYPAMNVVGEVFDTDPGLVSFFQAGKKQFDGVDSGVDTLFDFPLQAAIGRFFRGAGPAADVAKSIAHDSLYRDPNRLVTFLDLHDQVRFMSEPGATLAGLKNAFTFLFAVRGIPMVYYGDEIAMPGGADPDNRRDFPGGWKDDARNAFERAGRTADQESVAAHVARLGKVRAGMEALRKGAMVELLATTDQYAFSRFTGQEAALVIVNRASTAADLKIPLAGSHIVPGAHLTDALGAAAAADAGQDFLSVTVPAQSTAIYH